MSGWTTQQDAMLAALWAAGKSCSAIADNIGKSKNAVAGRRNRLGLPMRSNPITQKPDSVIRTERFAQLLSEGREIPAIAREMGVNTDIARGIFQRIRRDLGAQAK